MKKSIGVVRKLDELGRICVPKELRKTFNINVGDPLEIFTDNDCIVFKKYNPGCSMCGNLENVHIVDNIKICKECAKKIAKVVD